MDRYEMNIAKKVLYSFGDFINGLDDPTVLPHVILSEDGARFAITADANDIYRVGVLNDEGSFIWKVDVSADYGSTVMKVNWPGIGSKTAADTRLFARMLTLAADVADKATALLDEVVASAK
jgi:hypothetical protein